MSVSDLAMLVLFAALGAAAGLAYFWALRANLRLYFERRGWAAVLLALRLMGVAALFWLIAQAGAAALIAALAGFLAARFLFLLGVRRQPC